MKKFFRSLTAEANGFYLSSLHNFLNSFIEYTYPLLSYFGTVQLKTESDTTLSAAESPIEDDDLRGIAKVAGVFSPFISAESNSGSILFTSSKIVDGRQYSERGLYDVLTEGFKYFRTNQSVYPTDITTLATKDLRASLVPTGAPILGYIEEGTTVLTTDGKIIPSAILTEPPVGKAYYPYYGEKYLFLAESFLIEAYLDIDTLKELLESFQRIRYNGTSIVELVAITKLIMADFVYDVNIVPDGQKLILYFKLDVESELIGKTKRTFIWLFLLQQKFKQLIPSEVL